MRFHAQEIFKRNIQFILFILVATLCLVSSAIGIKAIYGSKQPIIIAIDSNGSRIVTDLNDPIYKTEAIAFVQKFLFNVYNFDSANFIKRIGFATSLMSEELWKKKESEILDLKSKIERDNIAISGLVIKMSRDDEGTYHAIVKATERTRLNEQEHQIEVALKLKSVSRNQDNPSGLEVDSYEESIIRN